MIYHKTTRGPYDINVQQELGAMLLGREHEMDELAQWAVENAAAWREDQEFGRTFTAEQRRKAAKEGASLPDGSYPIYSATDAMNALRRIGTGAASKDTILAHIRKRARQLGFKAPGMAGATSS
jgi:hypothetical protein